MRRLSPSGGPAGRAAQIGIPTGRITRLFVLDVDSPAAAQIVATWTLPETFSVETRPGRRQFWFRQSPDVETKCTASVLGPEIDTRGDKGYTIAPPSIHHLTGQPYRIVKDVPLADLPEFLLNPKAIGNGSGSKCDVSGDIPAGRRHHTLLSFAGSLRARGLSESEVLVGLETLNQRCNPPLDRAELEKLASYVGAKPTGGRAMQATCAEIEVQSYTDVQREELEWHWHGRIPAKKLTIFSGEPGEGKSLVTVDLAARKSTGASFPDGAPNQVGHTVLLNGEDDAGDTIRPRLDAAGADVRRVHRIKSVRVTLADGAESETSFSLQRDIEKLGELFSRMRDVKLFVVDPISMYLGETDTWKDSSVRQILGPFAELAQKSGVTCIGVMHPKKGDGTAQQRIVSGSIAFQAAARAVWGFAKDPREPGRHVMIPVKMNLSASDSGLAYRIIDVNGVAKIQWEGAANLDLESALGRSADREERSKLKETTEWLRELVASGPVLVSEIKAEAQASGHSWRSVERAKQILEIRATRTPPGPWYWCPSPPKR